MKRFSIDEAEALLPTLTADLLKARRLKTLLDEHDPGIRRRVMTDGTEELEEELDAEQHAILERFYETVERVNERGCLLRDVEEGAVDFPTRFEGKEVFLSWRLGERRIRHWHEGDEDRKRILEL